MKVSDAFLSTLERHFSITILKKVFGVNGWQLLIKPHYHKDCFWLTLSVVKKDVLKCPKCGKVGETNGGEKSCEDCE